MKFTTSILFAVQALSVLAIPQNRAARASAAAAAASSAAAVAAPAAGAGAGAGAGAAEENKENEVEQAGQFGQVIALGGGNIKTDTLFPPGVRTPSPPPTKWHPIPNNPPPRSTAPSRLNSKTMPPASCV